MQVTANELNAIKTVAVGLANLAKLGSFEGRDEMVKQFKQAKKVWWATMKSRYGLTSGKGSRRLSVELDGDKAGELRYKAKTDYEKSDTAGRVVPPAQASTAESSNGVHPTEEQRTALESAARALKEASEAIALMAPPRGSNGDGRVSYATD